LGRSIDRFIETLSLIAVSEVVHTGKYSLKAREANGPILEISVIRRKQAYQTSGLDLRFSSNAEIADAEIQDRLSCPFNQVNICNSLLSEQGSETL
jgi:hypothetical protein